MSSWVFPDLDALYDEHAESYKHHIKTRSWLSMRGRFEVKENPWPYQSKGSLSMPAMALLGVDDVGASRGYSNGFDRTQIIYRYYDAVLAIAADEEPPVELLTGKAFIFDPVTGELRLPADPLLAGLGIEIAVVP